MIPRLLVVDDDTAHRRMLETVLCAEGYEITKAADGQAAVEAVEERFYDIVLMDIRMSRMDGLAALKRIREINPEIPVIIMTAYADVATAVDALKSGAFDYLTKPLDIDELKILVKKALDHFRLEQENRNLKERLGERFDFSNIIGNGPAMANLFETISLVAPTDATILILGESGTGKELVANAIHENSPRSGRPFIKVNCAALPETLLESELFGHERGAFTGAVGRKEGRFRQAHTGTIFLDEIAEMPMMTQSKILRAIQEQEFEPLGGSGTVKVDIRVIAATNRVLEDEIREGRFREDLYYRLNVVSVSVPPLRDRREDIPPLADHFINIYAGKNQRIIKSLAPRAADMLMRYDWPGNIRELENAIERSVILSRGEVIAPELLPDTVRSAGGGDEAEAYLAPAGPTLGEAEKRMILKTLSENAGNRTKTAELLGISRRTLQLKLKKFGVNP